MASARDTPSFRLGVLIGAINATDSVRIDSKPCNLIMLTEWLEELAEWTNGPMPAPPSQWEAAPHLEGRVRD